MATVRNKMSQQQEELGPADTEDELGAFSTKGILGKQAGGGKKTLGEKSERTLMLSLTNMNEHRDLEKGWRLKNPHLGII